MVNMMKMITLAVGEQYPNKMAASQEGARADFLNENSNILLISMPNIDKKELKALKKGQLECGLLVDDGGIMLVWRFSLNNKPVVTLDSFFNAKLIKEISLYDITNSEERLEIEVHVVDTETNIIKAIKLMTMPNDLTLAFMSAVQNQIAFSGDVNKQLNKWLSESIESLFSQSTKYRMGV